MGRIVVAAGIAYQAAHCWRSNDERPKAPRFLAAERWRSL